MTLAQALLIRMGAASATSVIVCQRGDSAVEQALRKYAAFEVVEAGSGLAHTVPAATAARHVSAGTSARTLKAPRALASAGDR